MHNQTAIALMNALAIILAVVFFLAFIKLALRLVDQLKRIGNRQRDAAAANSSDNRDQQAADKK